MTGIEEIVIGAVIKGGAGSVAKVTTETLLDGGGWLAKTFGNSLKEGTKQAIYDASRQYVRNYGKRHCILKIGCVGMGEPVSLESIYTNVQLLEARNILKFTSKEEMEQAFRTTNKRRFEFEDNKTKKGIDVANEKQYLMVLGAPGAGKSTFLRKIGLDALKRNKQGYKHNCIPVFLELKRFIADEINIKEIIIKEFEICGFPKAEQIATKALEKGKLLILLDGLDEVPTKKLNSVIDTIQDFVDSYDKNRFIISCRTAFYQSSFTRFTDVEMADFDDNQIEQYINNWFNSESDIQENTATNCWSLLKQTEYKAAKELAKTPLLLTFLCLVYDKSETFPDNRSELYRKALQILLEEWAAEKRIRRDKIYQGLNTGLEEILLAKIAYEGFEKDKLFYDKPSLIEQIKDFLADNLNAPKHLDGKKVLNAIEVQQGILVQRAENIYSFSHLTLQEYLTAQYIVDNNLIKYLVAHHLTDTRWQEVFLLVAGLMRGGADELLLLMEKQAIAYLDTPVGKQKLIPILNWSENITRDSTGDLKPVAKRAIAYANAYAIAYANAYAIDNAIAYAIDNANAYAIDNAIAYAIDNAIAYAIDNAIAYAIDNA
ncbi:MAG: NACHT domain-containing protein, partial [Xenococcaceae cyanobacterium MO_167.B52]|nr:NACHT domain-containing protein [Xenococcaceae cyanobacterium MO_167.B52]